MKNKSVLIVDDEVSNLELFRMMLEMESFDVQIATNAEQAMTALRNNKPDVVLLDVMMPEVSGIELCKHIRSDPSLTSIPIIIISAKSQLEDVERGLAAGADFYLLKPVSKSELIQTVRQLM